MEEMYGMHFVAATGGGLASAEELQGLLAAAGDRAPPAIGEEGGQEMGGDMKARIASHPRYPKLLEAYINCQKVGAPPEIASFLDEIRRENDTAQRNAVSSLLGAYPELDEFMETFCDVLVKYRSDLSRPFDEATTFLRTIERQLSDLSKPSTTTSLPYISGKPRKTQEGVGGEKRTSEVVVVIMATTGGLGFGATEADFREFVLSFFSTKK